jgi:hypothetical protein
MVLAFRLKCKGRKSLKIQSACINQGFYKVYALIKLLQTSTKLVHVQLCRKDKRKKRRKKRRKRSTCYYYPVQAW